MHRIKFLGIFSSLLVVVLLLPMLAGGCAEQPTAKPTIKLIENDWSSQIICTEIIDQIVSEQLGYTTERLLLSPSLSWPAMEKGEADVAAEIWLPSRIHEIQPFLDRGTIELGVVEVFPGYNYWYIPRYVVYGDSARGIEPMAPDLKSILDLKEYWKLFENPEKPGLGELVSGSPGWVDQVMDASRIKAYELPLWQSNQSEAIMCARMIAADKKGEPLLMMLWSPHWLFGVVDLLALEEPDTWFEGAFEDEEVAYKCPKPVVTIKTVVRCGLKDTAPDVYRLVKNMQIGAQDISTLMLRVDVDEEEIAVVAADWISKNQNKIDQWLGK